MTIRPSSLFLDVLFSIARIIGFERSRGTAIAIELART
jgi:hypothetical protein